MEKSSPLKRTLDESPANGNSAPAAAASSSQPSSKSAKKVGEVRVAKLPGRYKGKWPEMEGFTRVNVASSNKGLMGQLSPFNLGPIRLADFGIRHDKDFGEQNLRVEMPLYATCVENLWQASKVWTGECSVMNATAEDPNKKYGMPYKEFFARRAEIWQDPKAHRHIKKGNDASGNKNIALYSLWGEEKLEYVPARKKIYCPIYAAMARKTDAFKELKRLHESGVNLLLVEFDGYDEVAEGKTLKECIDDKTRPFGHGLVLKCMLLGQEVWNN